MSSMLITAPSVGHGRLAGRAARVTAPRASVPRLVLAPPVRARQAPLRLTARGRAVLVAAFVAIGLAVSLFTGAISLAGTASTPVPVRYVTVGSGQTLWAIAGEVAPGVDRRDTVAQILELNALAGSGVQAGQQIAVPVGR